MVAEIPPLRNRFFALILTLGIPALAQANERFIQKCESSLTQNERQWFEMVLGTKDCREISGKISKMKSFEEILPAISMRPPVITLDLKFASRIDFDASDVLRDQKIKRDLFPGLDLFVGFNNLKHLSLIERKLIKPCDVIKKFPHLQTMTIDRNEFFSEGTDDCLAFGGLKGAILRDSIVVTTPMGPGKKAPIVRTKTHVIGVEYWMGSFGPLTNFPYLKYLHFQSAMALKGSGIEVLGSNLFLTHLLVDVGGFHDIQQLRHLKELRSLKISGKISDISFLRELQWIKHLSLENNQISDLSPLQSLPDLRTANFKNNRIHSLPDLSQLKKLKELNLSSNKLESLESFTGSSSLESLNLSGNSISDFSQLERYPNLMALNISANKSVGTLSLPSLSKLRILSIDGSSGRYKDSEAYETLQRVSAKVSLTANNFLPILRGNYSDGCETTPSFGQIENLNTFPELEVLTLRNQGLSSVPDISGLKNLRYLNLFGNNLKELPELGLSSLKLINLTDNKDYKHGYARNPEADVVRSEMILVNLACFTRPLLRTEPYPPL